MAGLFDSAWMKWGRAVVHARDLEEDIDDFTNDPDRESDFVFSYEYNARRHGFVVEVEEVDRLPPRWSLMLGDVAANLRSGLEHLAWAIVMRGEKGPTLTKADARGVSFPIYDDGRQFNGEVGRKLVGARRSDVARVRRMQPYQRGKRGAKRHALYTLNSLCNADKHRAIEPIRVVPTQGGYQILETRDCVPTTDPRRPRPRLILLEVGAEIGVVRVRKTGPDPYVKIDTQFVVRLGVTDRIPLDEWLGRILGVVRDLLLDFAVPPDQLADLGDPGLFFPADDPRSKWKSAESQPHP